MPSDRQRIDEHVVEQLDQFVVESERCELLSGLLADDAARLIRQSGCSRCSAIHAVAKLTSSGIGSRRISAAPSEALVSAPPATE